MATELLSRIVAMLRDMINWCIENPTRGRPLPDGETGEVEVRGPHVFAGYWRKPDETAAAIAFLASPAAGYVNGVNLPVDGGRSIYAGE